MSEDEEKMTLLQYITSELSAIKVDSPEAEARLVIEQLYNNDVFRQAAEADLSKFQNVLERRKKREPIQYILGKAFFFNSEFIVSPAVLIPRPETEIMVEKLIEELPRNGIMADIGCGSGCIGISVALERPDVQIYAFDISSDALTVARLNAENLKVSNIHFIESDLLEKCPRDIRFDAVGANLPYVPYEDYITAQLEVRKYEPEIALTAPDAGLEIIIRCVAELEYFMQKGGTAFFEIDPSQDTRLLKIFLDNNWQEAEIIKDYTSCSRFVKGIRQN